MFLAPALVAGDVTTARPQRSTPDIVRAVISETAWVLARFIATPVLFANAVLAADDGPIPTRVVHLLSAMIAAGFAVLTTPE